MQKERQKMLNILACGKILRILSCPTLEKTRRVWYNSGNEIEKEKNYEKIFDGYAYPF